LLFASKWVDKFFITQETPIAMAEIFDLEKATQTAKESLARTADNHSAQILRAIEMVEESLREKRSRIEEIQMRRDHLDSEYRKLNETLEWENSDLAQKLHAVVKDLDTDGVILELLPDMPTATETSDLDTDIADRDQQVRGSPDDKQNNPSFPVWLKKNKKRDRGA
jgi:uncharacterized FlaG/YvyC family protein